MFDIGWTEIAIIGIIALIIIGPKDLPRVLRTLGQWTGKARALTREFRGHVDDLVRESELEDVKGQFDDIRQGNIGDYVENTIDPDGELRQSLDYGSDLNLDDDKAEEEESIAAAEGFDDGAPDDRPDDIDDIDIIDVIGDEVRNTPELEVPSPNNGENKPQ
jgi:Tat protein translocase TatB subunit